MSITLRPVTANDIALTQQWAQDIASERFMSRTLPLQATEQGHDPTHGLFWYLIQERGSPVGTVWIEITKGSAEPILGIFLRGTSLFGRGIGGTAIDQAIVEVRGALGPIPIALHVRTANRRALACYQRAGFTLVDAGTKINSHGTSVPFFKMVHTPLKP